MTDQERQAMLAAIRSMADSIEEVTGLVAEVPAKVQQQVDAAAAEFSQVRATLMAGLDEAKTQMREMLQQFGEMRAAIDSSVAATAASLRETLAEHAKIIGDNRAAFDAAQEETQKAFTGSAGSTQAIAASITGLIGKSDSAITALEARAAELTSRITTVDSQLFELHAELPKIKQSAGEEVILVQSRADKLAEELRAFVDAKVGIAQVESAGAVAEVRSALSNAIMESSQQTDDRLAEIKAGCKVLVDAASTALHGQITETEQALRAEVAQVKQAAIEYTTELGRTVSSNDEQARETEAAIQRGIAGINERLETVSTLANVQEVKDSFDVHLSALKTAHSEITTQVGDVKREHQQMADELRADMADTRAAMGTQARAASTAVSEASETLAARVAAVEGTAGELGQLLAETQRSAQLARAEVEVKIDASVAELRDAAQATTATLQAGYVQLGEQVEAVKASVSAVDKTIEDRIAGVDLAGRERLATAGTKYAGLVAQQVAALTEQIAAVGEQSIKAIEAVDEQAKTTATAQRTELREFVLQQVGEVNTSLSERITAEGVQVRAATGEQIIELCEQQKATGVVLAGLEGTLMNAVGTVKSELAATIATVQEKADTNAESILGVHTMLVGSEATTAEEIGGLAARLDLRIDQTLETIKSTDAALRKDIDGYIGDVKKSEELYYEATINTVTDAEVKTLAAIAELKAVPVQAPGMYEPEVVKLVQSMLPEPGATPEQMAELQVRLSAALPQPAVPEFEVEYVEAEGGIAITAKSGDSSSRTVVPLRVGMQFKGVYNAESKYIAGDFVTRDGSGWVCKGNPTGAPGVDITGWTLAVKGGRNGKPGNSIKAYSYHEEGTRYNEGDFLRAHNHLWQATRSTMSIPEGAARESTPEWTLIGGVH